MNDPTEPIRRDMVQEINAREAGRAEMEEEHGQVWNTQEATNDFTFHSFLAPFVLVTRKSDGARGSLMFQHRPRFYYGFKPEKG